MSGPLEKPARKNPLLRTRVPLLPPAGQSRRAHDLTAAAAEGRFALQRCVACGDYAYPAREACPRCLSPLEMAEAPDTGTVLSRTAAEVPADGYFRERAPWHVGLVKLDCGPTVLAHLHPASEADMAVRAHLMLDRSGRAVIYAAPIEGGLDLTHDPQWREMTADPRHRRVLITDGRNPVTVPLIEALQKAGAGQIFVGLAEVWKPAPALERAGVSVVALDLRDERSVDAFARDYGAKVEIVVNTADHLRPGGVLDARLDATREAMEVLVFGTLRLSRALAPVMMSRAADGPAGAVAWVNVLSILARAPSAGFSAYAAAQAAALSISLSLRGELAGAGIRLLNVFSGPTDTEWYQPLPQPKVAPRAVAEAVVAGLKRGLEESYVGDVAKELKDRLDAQPKAVERESARGQS